MMTADEIQELRKESAAIKQLRATLVEPGAAKRVFEKASRDDLLRTKVANGLSRTPGVQQRYFAFTADGRSVETSCTSSSDFVRRARSCRQELCPDGGDVCGGRSGNQRSARVDLAGFIRDLRVKVGRLLESVRSLRAGLIMFHFVTVSSDSPNESTPFDRSPSIKMMTTRSISSSLPRIYELPCSTSSHKHASK